MKIALNDGHLALMRKLAFKSMPKVPMWYGEELIGALTLFMGRSGRRHTLVDMSFAAELAALAAPVIVNVRLLEKQWQASAALKDSEEHLRLAIESGGMGTWQWHIQNGQSTWKPGMASFHGLAEGAKAAGSLSNYADLIHPDDRNKVIESVHAAIAGKKEHLIEYRVIWPDERICWLEGGKILCDDRGEPLQIVGVCADITQHRHREQGLRFVAQASEELASIVDPQRTLDKIALGGTWLCGLVRS